MRFLANLNIAPLTVEALGRKGWDIARTSSLPPATSSDEEILETTRKEDRIVVTQDLDFSALPAAAGFERPGPIPLRLTAADSDSPAMRLRVVPQRTVELRAGGALTIDDGGVRVRRLPWK